MTSAQLITVVVGLVGVVLGAILKNFFDRREGRTRFVSYSVTGGGVSQFIKGREFYTVINVVIPDGPPLTVDKVYQIGVKVTNDSGKDFAEFPFGVTFPEGTMVTYLRHVSADRHHRVRQVTTECSDVSPHLQDLELYPFNRGDTYRLDFNAIALIKDADTEQYRITASTADPEQVKLSTDLVGVELENTTPKPITTAQANLVWLMAMPALVPTSAVIGLYFYSARSTSSQNALIALLVLYTLIWIGFCVYIRVYVRRSVNNLRRINRTRASMRQRPD